MMKVKQIELIKEVFQADKTSPDKLNSIASIAINPNNKVMSIFFDPELSLEQKLIDIHDSIKTTEKNIRKYRKYAQLIGTACLVIYTFLQTIGLI